jgi:hypothetical protein
MDYELNIGTGECQPEAIAELRRHVATENNKVALRSCWAPVDNAVLLLAAANNTASIPLDTVPECPQLYSRHMEFCSDSTMMRPPTPLHLRLTLVREPPTPPHLRLTLAALK